MFAVLMLLSTSVYHDTIFWALKPREPCLEKRFLDELTHIRMASFYGIGKQNSPRWDAAKRGVPSGAILFAYKKFIEK